jgi:phosphoglycolate phosphatase-like HAD superfamily hydrolase
MAPPYRVLLFDIDGTLVTTGGAGAAAAHAVGCTAVAVATGRYDSAALRAAGADHVLESLEQELPL